MKFVSFIFAALSVCIFSMSAVASPQRENPRASVSQSRTTAAPAAQSRSAVQMPSVQSRSAIGRNKTILNRSRAAQQPATISRSAVRNKAAINSKQSGANKSRSAVSSPRLPRNPNDSKPRAVQARSAIRARSAVESAQFGTAEYNQCKDAYSQCMDQFCSGAEDKVFGRCLCSDKRAPLEKRNENVSIAMSELKQFADSDLRVIGEDAAAVTYMLNETAAEEAAALANENETEFSQRLNSISDRLSGSNEGTLKKYDFGNGEATFDFDNLFEEVSLLNGNQNGMVDINKTGDALYEDVHDMCQDMLNDVCSPKNLSLAVSLYKQSINKDCDRAENTIKKKESEVKDNVSKASVLMMELRLDDFNEKNSLSAIECLENAIEQMQTDAVCGEGYKKCLDPSVQYIDANGDVIYSDKFADLGGLMAFPEAGQSSLAEVGANAAFVNMLQSKRFWFEDNKILESCAQDADRVWAEVINRTLLEIVTAQRQRVESLKSECLIKMTNCMTERTDTFEEFAALGETPSSQTETENKTNSNSTQTAAQKLIEHEKQIAELNNTRKNIEGARLICQEIEDTCEAIYPDLNGLLSARLNDMEENLTEAAREAKEKFEYELMRAMCTAPAPNGLGGKWEIRSGGAVGEEDCVITRQ